MTDTSPSWQPKQRKTEYTMLDINSTVHVNELIFTTTLNKEVVALNKQGDMYYTFSESGHKIWELLETPIKVESLCEALSALYDGEKQSIVADTLLFLTRLAEKGLIRVS